jgi:hypothetical protein
MNEQTAEKMPVFELSYQGYVVGWIDSASAFNPANEDDLYINSAVLARLAA